MPNTDLFTTIPQSIKLDRNTFIQEVRKIAHQSENNGYKGTLIYSDNRLADPWTIAGFLLAETQTLLPMIALQPAYMHPYMAAKKIATLALLYQRPISLNLIAGGFSNDLISLNEHTEHDRRYDRLVEYTEIMQLLMKSEHPVSYEGDFYTIKNLRLQPDIPEELRPLYYLSGSSDAAKSASKTLGAKLIEYPEPHASWENQATNGTSSRGIRIGILTRQDHDEAWKDARVRFPDTRQGAITHKLAQKTSDSQWHKKLSDQSEQIVDEEPVYWLGPFNFYHTFCPYLVGDYQEVTEELSHYIKAGCDTCILDIPVSEEELLHTNHVFELAENLVLQ